MRQLIEIKSHRIDSTPIGREFRRNSSSSLNYVHQKKWWCRYQFAAIHRLISRVKSRLLFVSESLLRCLFRGLLFWFVECANLRNVAFCVIFCCWKIIRTTSESFSCVIFVFVAILSGLLYWSIFAPSKTTKMWASRAFCRWFKYNFTEFYAAWRCVFDFRKTTPSSRRGSSQIVMSRPTANKFPKQSC